MLQDLSLPFSFRVAGATGFSCKERA